MKLGKRVVLDAGDESFGCRHDQNDDHEGSEVVGGGRPLAFGHQQVVVADYPRSLLYALQLLGRSPQLVH